jgi:hypothetical protein
MRLPDRPDDGLHSDADLQGLIEKKGDKESAGKLRLLDVIPRGKSEPRAEEFKGIGLDETRMRERSVSTCIM